METIYSEVIKQLEKHLDDVQVGKEIVRKPNGVELTGIYIRKIGENIGPVVYIDHLIKEGKDTDYILDEVIRQYNRTMDSHDECLDIYKYMNNFDSIVDYLSIRLMNEKENEELLRDFPYKVVMGDLAAVLVVTNTTSDQSGFMTVKVNYDILKMWNKTFDELYDIAISNLYVEGTVIKDLGLVLQEFDRDIGMPCPDGYMYVLTNRRKHGGAANILDQTTIDDFKQSHPGKIIAIPSSIHEWLLVPVADERLLDDLEYANELVQTVNNDMVDKVEVLSDHVYIL